jgi:hypothetical protein
VNIVINVLKVCPPSFEYFELQITSRRKRWKWGLSITPTYLRCKLTFNLDDYGKKTNMKRACNKKGRAEMTLPLKVVLVR